MVYCTHPLCFMTSSLHVVPELVGIEVLCDVGFTHEYNLLRLLLAQQYLDTFPHNWIKNQCHVKFNVVKLCTN